MLDAAKLLQWQINAKIFAVYKSHQNRTCDSGAIIIFVSLNSENTQISRFHRMRHSNRDVNNAPSTIPQDPSHWQTLQTNSHR